MSTKDTQQSNSKPSKTDRSFIIKQVFIKKSTLVVDKSPFELKAEWKPDAAMQLNVTTKSIDDSHQLIDLIIDINVKIEESPVFTCAVIQSGIFEMSGYTDEQNSQLRNSFCPNILFPYARQLISQLTSQAGFPPLIIAPVDFEGRYQQLQQAAKDKIN